MNIYDLTYSELESFFESRGENKAKAKAVFNCIYKNRGGDFGEITEFGERARLLLADEFTFGEIETLSVVETEDAAKFLFRLSDSNTVEAVLMRHIYGHGLCISTQVGCNMGCAFCESGRHKKIRDLLPSEMIMQFLAAERAIKSTITHITLMGVGEPLDNFENVMRFIETAGNPHGLDIAKRHVTISTCGIVPRLCELTAMNTAANLAISLHAPNDELRSRLVPINRTYNIQSLINAVRDYSREKNRKTAIEYVMLRGVNDSEENACELATLLKDVYCYVNLIPYNKTTTSEFERSDADTVSSFCRILLDCGIRTTVRREFGGELKAACGQLRTEKGNP